MRFLEHPTRASRWRASDFEVLPEAASAELTVWFSLPPDTHTERTWEGLLAHESLPGHAVIAAVPAYAYGVNLGDEVAVVASAEGGLVATSIARDAGQYTFRVMFSEHADSGDDERWRRLQQDLEQYGCWFDVMSPRFVAISADPVVAQDVADWLYALQAAGDLHYETGRMLDPPRG